jgi:hypothetical protein
VDGKAGCRDECQTFGEQFYLDYAKTLAGIGKLLPGAPDRNACRHAVRIVREHEGRQFGLLVDDIHTDEELRRRLREFLLGLRRADAMIRTWRRLSE